MGSGGVCVVHEAAQKLLSMNSQLGRQTVLCDLEVLDAASQGRMSARCGLKRVAAEQSRDL